MTTPEQLQAWRDEANKVWGAEGRTHGVNMSDFDNYAAGYIHAKQETEQVMKLAKFGAMVIGRLGTASEPAPSEMWDMAGNLGLLMPNQSDLNEAANTAIQELLK